MAAHHWFICTSGSWGGGGLLSSVAEGSVLLGGVSFGGGEPTSRTKVFLGCLLAGFFLVVAHFLVVASFFLREGSDAISS